MATTEAVHAGTLSTEQVLDLIFKDPTVKHGLGEFADLKKPAHEIVHVFPKVMTSGKAKGEVRYFIKCFKRGTDIQVYSDKKSCPEEIVRQLWLYKLHHLYAYPWNMIEVEYAVKFGTVTADKAADILVFQSDGSTAKIVIEVKKPDRKDGLGQLKSYLNAEGSPVGVWSNGNDRIILYRPYPKEFDDTLTEIPTFSQQPADVLKQKITLTDLKPSYDFRAIIEDLEELVLANSGDEEFNEIFKIIFAKLFDEKAAKERKNEELHFRKSDDPDGTYEIIDGLFRQAMDEWPAIFDENEHIKLTPEHLQVCIGPLERLQLLGANMRIMDDAFEYLMPSVAKKKNGQFFTPRYVIDMCVKMLNPTRKEHVLDPACGSAGFLIHTLDWVWPAPTNAAKEERKHKYASQYLWGIDFDERSAKVSRALMLIAGDGRSHVFRANSLDPRDWFRTQQGEALRTDLRQGHLLANKPPATKLIKEAEAWDYFSDLKFDLILTNPPFAGEIRDRELLRQYRLAAPALARKSKKGAKEERDVLFIERCIHMLKPGGRMAIVLPQGKFNNALLSFIRHWILRQARIIGVVGLHGNTFKPHTGTKTSVLLLSKYTEEERQSVEDLVASISNQAPNYREIITQIVNSAGEDGDVEEAQLPDEIADALVEKFSDMPTEQEENGKDGAAESESSQNAASDNELDPDALKEEIEEKEGALNALVDAITTIRGQKKAVRLKKKDDAKGIAAKAAILEKLAHEEAYLVPRLKAAIGELKELKRRLSLVTTKGRLMLLAEDEKAIGRITEVWVTEQLSGKLQYPVFMATSQESGKDSSGEYVYRYKDGTFAKDAGGNPLVEQDCVSYVEGEERIAEAFIKWAKKHDLPFWKEA